MKKLILAAVIGVALCAMPNSASAQVPYYGGYYVAPYPVPMPAYNTFSYYSTPWGYRSVNTAGYNMTPWGWNAYNFNAVNTRLITNAPYHSIYLDARGNARMGTGYMNTPTFYQSYRLR